VLARRLIGLRVHLRCPEQKSESGQV